MSVTPEIVAHQLPPPSSIRLLLVNDGNKKEHVEVTLEVMNRSVRFCIGTEDGPRTEQKDKHTLSAEHLTDSVYYLWEWGPAAAADTLKVTILHGGTAKWATADVLPPSE